MINPYTATYISEAVTALSGASLLPASIRADALAGALVATDSRLNTMRVEDVAKEVEHFISEGPILLGGRTHRGFTSTALSSAISEVIDRPTIDGVEPENNATDVPYNTGEMIVTFDMEIELANGTWSLWKEDTDDELIITLDRSDVFLSDADKVTIPLPDLDPEENYYLTFTEGAVANKGTGVPCAAVTTDASAEFTTASLTALDSSTPADDATEVGVSADITLTFTRDVEAGAGSISLHLTSSDAVVYTWDMTEEQGNEAGEFSITDDTITLKLPEALENSTGYYITWTADALLDDLGQPVPALTDKTALNFTTEAE